MARRATVRHILAVAVIAAMLPLAGCGAGSTVDGKGIQAPGVGEGGVSEDAPQAPSSEPPSATSEAATAVTTEDTAGAMQCLVRFSPASGPKWSADSHTVTGGIQFVCPDPPKVWRATLWLEYQSTGSAWRSNPGWGDTATAQDPGHDMLVGAGCRVGGWRFRYSVNGKDADGKTIAMADTSPETYATSCP